MTIKKEAKQQKIKDIEEKAKKRQEKFVNTVRINRELNRGIIDRFIQMKHCPLLTNKYDCGILRGYNLKKGKEKQCHCPDFINCPAFNQYVSHQIIQNRRGVTRGVKVEADAETESEAAE